MKYKTIQRLNSGWNKLTTVLRIALMKNLIDTELPRAVANDDQTRLLFDAYMDGRFGTYRILYDHRSRKVVLAFNNEEDASAFTLAQTDSEFISKYLKPYDSAASAKSRNSGMSTDELYRHMFEHKIGSKYDRYK